MEVAEQRAELGGLEIFWREAGDDGRPAPVLYLHGVPTSGADWTPFLELTGGLAPDLPGFGRSAKPANFDYSIAGYDRFTEAFCSAAGLERLSMVLHDWGAVGLAFAQRFPERIERLVLLSCVPFLPGYRWHRVARIWRTPVAGELAMGFTTKSGMRRGSRLPAEYVESFWPHFDHGTQRAILKLYRSSPEAVLERAGERLGEVRCPALVLWPTHDPYIPAKFGRAYAGALGGEVDLEMVDGGHWTWLDRPELIPRVADFLS